MDGRHLRGANFCKFTVFIPKNCEYLAQLSVRSTQKNGGRQKGYKGARKSGESFIINFLNLLFFLDIKFLWGAKKNQW